MRRKRARNDGRLNQRDLAAVFSRPAAALPPLHREKLERLLDADLSGVRVRVSQESTAACAKLGALAFALGEDLCFAEGAYAPDTPTGQRLLAHELAHVLQQRLGASHPIRRRSAWDTHTIETEADLAADAVMYGDAFRVVTPDASREPALWGLCGHYYTPYLIFLNAGVDPKIAQRLALWCWMPDQVQELDAAHLGFNWATPGNVQWHGPRDNMASKANGATYANETQYVKAVQAGLHVLTGKSSAAETTRRTAIFKNGGHMKLVYRGLALHAYGDCFAHREFDDPGTLFGDAFSLPAGHASLVLQGQDPHAPDHVWEPQRAVIYMTYVLGLYELAQAYQSGSPVAPFADLMLAISPVNPNIRKGSEPLNALPNVSRIAKALSNATVPADEMKCAAHFRMVAQRLVGRTMATDELADRSVSVPWAEYSNVQSRRAALLEDSNEQDIDQVFFNIQKYAVEWSGVALAPRKLPPPVGKREAATLPPTGFSATTGWARRR